VAAPARLRAWARRIKQELVALYHAARDPRTPWPARLVAGLVVAYALSPIDLIPDFVRVLGYLDDLLLVPLGLLLAVRLIPPEVLAEHRARAVEGEALPRSRTAAGVILSIWVFSLGLLAGWFFISRWN
jgi:uncharacterized membrane protein YkvA (DUF1232 family)